MVTSNARLIKNGHDASRRTNVLASHFAFFFLHFLSFQTQAESSQLVSERRRAQAEVAAAAALARAQVSTSAGQEAADSLQARQVGDPQHAPPPLNHLPSSLEAGEVLEGAGAGSLPQVDDFENFTVSSSPVGERGGRWGQGSLGVSAAPLT